MMPGPCLYRSSTKCLAVLPTHQELQDSESDHSSKPRASTLAQAQEGRLPPPPPRVLPSSSWSLDEAEPSVLLDDFRAHQELLKRMASYLGIEAEELKDTSDTLLMC